MPLIRISLKRPDYNHGRGYCEKIGYMYITGIVDVAALGGRG